MFKRWHWLVGLIALLFGIVTTSLLIAQHEAYQTRIFDFGRFSHAIWNTTKGQFLYTSITDGSILGNHFSPIMALYAPLLRLIPDERILFVIQVANVIMAGLIITALARRIVPHAAVWIALLWFLNPAVHDITLFELRRIIFGLPFLALAVYGLVTKQRPHLLIGLALALLAKESVAIYVSMIGLYLITFERAWTIGMTLFGVGLLWLFGVSGWVIPMFSPATDIYPQLYYYDHYGESYTDIVRVAFREPWRVIRPLFAIEQRRALIRLILPFGFIPLISWRLLLIPLPYIALMFLSNDYDMRNLDKWYTTTILPFLFGGLIIGTQALPKRWTHPVFALLTLFTVVTHGFTGALGRDFDSTRYQRPPEYALYNQLIDHIPTDGTVVAHTRLIPHMTHIQTIYAGYGRLSTADYAVLYRHEPFQLPTETWDEEIVDQIVTDLSHRIIAERDGLYVVALDTADHNLQPTSITYDGMKLDQIGVATAAENTLFTDDSFTSSYTAGDTVRVTLNWLATADIAHETTVSIRMTAQDGTLITQHDKMPLDGLRPTTTWRTADHLRDTHYLPIPSNTPTQPVTIDITLYDSWTQEPRTFPNGQTVTTLLTGQIVAP